MSDAIPDNIRTRLEAFLASGQTGQIVLNIRHGGVVSADIHVHLKATPEKNIVDKAQVAQ